ncbi:MAG TPA: sulfotransferase [Sandaracinaceae bacterium LLY-WYZ-13_1]|nr:sulfotransferase [Sandaracinaceae bacterium LLY-WYZ-13_1]
MTDRVHRLGVAICGAGHSGSTLLGLVLGSHSACFYAGEAKKTLFIGDPDKPLRKRVCKICGAGCPVWGRFEVPPRPDVLEQIARLTGAPTVVDSTKNVAWIRERAAELDAVGVPQKRIFLARDGRAVVNSRVRKYPDEDPAAVIDAWLAQVEATRALLAERPGDALTVRYEALATEPEPVVRRVCEHLGLDFEPAMLRYETHEHHPLGGNTGTQSVVARAAKVDTPLAKVPARSRSYYAGLGGGFRLDRRWERELPDAVRALFERRAGEVNEAFRWEGAGR